MRDFVVRILGGIPRRKYMEDVIGRQAIINGLRKNIDTMQKSLDILKRGER